jgi:NTE family protein
MTSQLSADLVLEGGGVKGIALAGAISVLGERGYAFHKVAGTSAGSIVGALVAAGTRPNRLREMLHAVDYARFQDPPLLGRLGPFGMAAQVILCKGWCRGDYLRSWLDEMLSEQGVRTFADLALDDVRADDAIRNTPGRNYRFVAMASDLTHGRLARLPWDYPERFHVDPDDARVSDAVRASMAIPYFYMPARLRDHVSGDTAWMVDGGMLSNFPVDVFDRTDGFEPRWPTLGIKLSTRSTLLRVNEVRGVVTLSKAMLSTMTGFYDRQHVSRADVIARTIFVDTLGVKAVDFNLSRETADALFESGRTAARTFLDGGDGQPKWDFEEYKRIWRHTQAPSESAA